MARLSLVALVLLQAACSANSDATCGTKPLASTLTPVESKILQASVQRASRTCGEGGEKCHFSVLSAKDELRVFGQIAPLRAGKCVRVSGGNWIDRYDAEGHFLGHLSGL